MKHSLKLMAFFIFGFLPALHARADSDWKGKDPNATVIFEQKLNQNVQLDLPFRDESGATVALKNFFHRRPVIIEMGYFDCPMLCGVVLNAVVRSVLDMPPSSAGRDFDFIFISVDPHETPALAKAKRQNYLKQLAWKPAAERWHFLTGTPASIQAVAAQIGFHFRYDSESKQYVHPSGIVVLTPDGRISKYFLGVEFPFAALQNAIAAARSKEVGSPVQQILLLCFEQSAKPGSVAFYVVNSLRIGALLTVVGLVVFLRFCAVTPKKRDARS